MRGRMFVSGALLAALVAPLSGCGTDEGPCFEGPAVTYTHRFEDWINASVPIEEVEVCHMVGERACGCQRSDATGRLDLPLPAGEEVMVRIRSDVHVPLVSFYETLLAAGFYVVYPMVSLPLMQAYADMVGVEPTFFGSGAVLGAVAASAAPVDGASMEGSLFELLDPSGMPVEVDGPFYSDQVGGLPAVDASSSVGNAAFAVWANVPPGRYVVRVRTASGENLYEKCSVAVFGWERRLDGDVVMEIEVFAGHASTVARRECEP
jgi:hypothetical protein